VDVLASLALRAAEARAALRVDVAQAAIEELRRVAVRRVREVPGVVAG